MDNARIADSLTTGLGSRHGAGGALVPRHAAGRRCHLRRQGPVVMFRSGAAQSPASSTLPRPSTSTARWARWSWASTCLSRLRTTLWAGQADARSQLHHGRGASAGPQGAEGVAGHPLRSAQDFPVAPDLILTWMTPSQAMLYNEAEGDIQWVSSSPPKVLGRPGCAALRSRCWSRSRR